MIILKEDYSLDDFLWDGLNAMHSELYAETKNLTQVSPIIIDAFRDQTLPSLREPLHDDIRHKLADVFNGRIVRDMSNGKPMTLEHEAATTVLAGTVHPDPISGHKGDYSKTTAPMTRVRGAVLVDDQGDRFEIEDDGPSRSRQNRDAIMQAAAKI